MQRSVSYDHIQSKVATNIKGFITVHLDTTFRIKIAHATGMTFRLAKT